MKKSILKFNQLGQSLLETVFAIGILLLVASAILALATANIVWQKESEFQIIANNLAREGVEVIRNIRDSNWLSGNNWDTGFEAGGAMIVRFNSASNSWQAELGCSGSRLYNDSSGVYSHEVTPSPSAYARCITIENICLDGSGSESIGSPCGVGDQKVGVKVTSVVNWQDRGRNRSTLIEDLLYEWK